MKRILTSIIAITLIAAALAGCAAPTEMPRGYVKNNVYTCRAAELTFTMPGGWEFEDSFDLSQHYWSYPDTLVDMCMHETETDIHVSVAYEDLVSTGKTGCDEEAYFDLKKKKMIKKSLPNTNYEFSEYTDVIIGSNSFKSMSLVTNVKTESEVYTSSPSYYFIRREGNCMICIYVEINKDYDIDSVMANFS